jgi:hypothetical protein
MDKPNAVAILSSGLRANVPIVFDAILLLRVIAISPHSDAATTGRPTIDRT